MSPPSAITVVGLHVLHLSRGPVGRGGSNEFRSQDERFDTDRNTKGVASLLELRDRVKLFQRRQREATRYDHSMERFEKGERQDLYLAGPAQYRGRRFIFTAGLAATMLMVRVRNPQRHPYGRRFRHDQTPMMMPVYQR